MNVYRAQIPMVRIVIPLLCGIIIFLNFDFEISGTAMWIIASILFALLIVASKVFNNNYQLRWVFGVVCSILLIIAGIKITYSNNQLNNATHFNNYKSFSGYAIIKITEPVSEKTNSYQVNGTIKALINNDSTISVSGKILMYLEKCTKASQLKYGDIIITPNNYNRTNPPTNPNSFNFKKFLSNNNIYHQAYFRADSWHFTGKNNGNYFLKTAHQFRKTALNILENNNISGREYAVASALVLGFRDYLDEELQQGFAGAGAMHVLCVSGLHVGIIFLVLKSIFGFLQKLKRGSIIKALLIIAFIWLYAAITGFSPSVQRASTMFTFVAIGSSFNRKTNIYNTLSASAVFLILLDPYIITRIGFQLSYIAVIGIVSLQPHLYKKLKFKNKILDKAWAIITVSIAAQLATGPLGLYYFNQFPNYFILTNLIVIPLASLIIYAALSVIVLSPFSAVSSLFGIVLSKLILAMHKAVTWIEALPGSVSSGIYLTGEETLLIFLVIISFSIALLFKRKLLLYQGLISTLLLFSSFSYREYQNNKNDFFVVYDIRNSSAIDFFYENNNIFVSCKSTRSNERNIDFHIKDNRIAHGIRHNVKSLCIDELPEYLTVNFAIKNNFIHFNNKRILILNTINSRIKTQAPFELDYLIVSQNPRLNIENTIRFLRPAKVIIDSSNNRFVAKNWKQTCMENEIPFWDVNKRGAYISGN